VSFIIEPHELFSARQLQAAQDAFAYTAADPHIFSALASGPQHGMRVLNRVVRQLPYNTKRQKIAVGRAVLGRITALIRAGKIRRLKRKYLELCTYSASDTGQAHPPAKGGGSTRPVMLGQDGSRTSQK